MSAPPIMPKMQFYGLGIGPRDEEVDGMKLAHLKTCLRDHGIRNGTRKILKLDIEGAEFASLASAMDILNEFDHLLMEVHYLDFKNETMYKPIKDLQKYFYLYHVHYNNNAAKDGNGKFVFETSWIRKDIAKQVRLSESSFPTIGLD